MKNFILTCYIGYVTPNGIKPLYFTFNRIIEYIKENYGNQ